MQCLNVPSQNDKMKRIIYFTLCALALTTFLGFAADNKKSFVEKPDFNKIKSEIQNPDSRFYYPRLMQKYESNDTSMSVEDYRYLYLGTLYQEDYNPYRKSEHRDKIEELYYRETHSRFELDSIIAYAELSLADDPFDLEQMNYLIYALRGRKKDNTANLWQFRLNHILQAIISTGTGLDPENAWYVINPRHEYNIVNFQNRTVESQEFQQPYYDYIKLTPAPDTGTKSPEGYYFNIHRLLEEYYRKFPDEL